MDPVSWTFTTAASASSCPCTIWPARRRRPGTDPDTQPVELGVKFRTDTAGFITGIRYYKADRPPAPTSAACGPRPAPGSATVTFTGEHGQRLAGGDLRRTRSPVTANTTYVASYFTPNRYAVERRLLRARGTTRGR